MAAKRIVIVDDDPKVRELIEWTLRPPEFEVFGFEDPRDALSKLEEAQPHLIICDMMMPDMDGRMFLRMVKDSEQFKDVPFLFLTAVRVGSEVQAAFEMGAAAFLVKPFPVARLVRTIRDVLEAGPKPAAPPVADTAASLATTRAPTPERRVASRRLDLDALQAPTDDDFTEMVAGRTLAELAASPPGAPERASPPSAEPLEGGAPPLERPPVSIEGRFSTVELGGLRIQVMTEAESRPNFVVTTLVSRDGQGIRRIETSWSQPLKRLEDSDIVRSQIDLQHERILDEVRRGPLHGPRRRTIWERGEQEGGSAD